MVDKPFAGVSCWIPGFTSPSNETLGCYPGLHMTLAGGGTLNTHTQIVKQELSALPCALKSGNEFVSMDKLPQHGYRSDLSAISVVELSSEQIFY